MYRPWKGCVLALVASMLLGCQVRGAGGAVLSVPMHRSVPAPASSQEMLQRHLEAVEQQRQAGVEGMFVARRWNELEPAAERYDLLDLRRGVDHFKKQNMQVFFRLQPIDTLRRAASVAS